MSHSFTFCNISLISSCLAWSNSRWEKSGRRNVLADSDVNAERWEPVPVCIIHYELRIPPMLMNCPFHRVSVRPIARLGHGCYNDGLCAIPAEVANVIIQNVNTTQSIHTFLTELLFDLCTEYWGGATLPNSASMWRCRQSPPDMVLSLSHLFQKVAIRFSTEHIPSRLVILSRKNCQIVHQTCLRFFWRDNLAKGSW